MVMPGKGDTAPGFSLDGTDGTEEGRRTYSLEEFRGDPVVLVFYPADNSPVCTVQLRSYTEDISSFADVGAHVLAISPQSVEDHDCVRDGERRLRLPTARRCREGGRS